MVYTILLCGGIGTRLWPLSRRDLPKQFTMLLGEVTLFQATARRFAGPGFAAPVVVTAEQFRFVVTDQLAGAGLKASATLIEPDPRNTAPAVLCAALWLRERDPDALVLVAPTDHVMPEGGEFCAAVEAALPAARAGQIVTFGISPAGPETGYGYLELATGDGIRAKSPQRLAGFIEKPESADARRMLAAGNYLWNAGIFLSTAATIIAAFARHAPEMIAPATDALRQSTSDLNFIRLAAEPWGQLPSISIDHAIMEKTKNLAVMPYQGGWSDLGSWDAVWQESRQDAEGNVLSGHALAVTCRNSLLRSEADGLELVGIGLQDIIAVAMPDAVLVARRGEGQKVREAVAALKQRSAKQATSFSRDHRPWGWFESLAIGPRFQVKRIVVKPGAALSLQSHRHRAEHWIVVQGTARVTVGGETRLLAENESTFIRVGAIHRLENPGTVTMILIEVQTGSYLGEDDIIRYDDVYARTVEPSGESPASSKTKT